MYTISSFLVNVLIDKISALQKRCKNNINYCLYNLHQNYQQLLFCHIYFINLSIHTYNFCLNYLRVSYIHGDSLPLNMFSVKFLRRGIFSKITTVKLSKLDVHTRLSTLYSTFAFHQLSLQCHLEQLFPAQDPIWDPTFHLVVLYN